jgi:CRISPR/Cas system CSM-associated protein Csm3 (group 7 of RAMP superfamily)
MARETSHSLILEGQLVALGPVHVGGADSGHESDMALAVDGLGRPYLPGTSLAGAIRAWERIDMDAEDVRWGFVKAGDRGSASRVIIDDAPLLNHAATELWHGVGIDRVSGTAADGIKFDRQVLPAGARFRFRLQLDVASGDELAAQRAWIARLRDALAAGEIAFGAGRTRGLGRFGFVVDAQREQDWTCIEGLIATLERGGHDAGGHWKTAKDPAIPSSSIAIRVHWRPAGPVMSKAALDGSAVDGLPLTSARSGKPEDPDRVLLLPGSSIKGALRGHAERIVRSVLGLAPVRLDDGRSRHLDQVHVPLVDRLFGAARPPRRSDGKTPIEGGARGWLRVGSCYSKLVMTASAWEALADRPAAWAATGWNAKGPAQLYRADHVAVDRWTGGAADGLLYSAVEPAASIEWEPFELRLDPPSSADPRAALALLWLVLRDLAAGRITLGFGANRGYGAVAVERIAIDGLDLIGLAPRSLEVGVDDGRLDEAPASALVDVLRRAWSEWMATQGEAA